MPLSSVLSPLLRRGERKQRYPSAVLLPASGCGEDAFVGRESEQ